MRTATSSGAYPTGPSIRCELVPGPGPVGRPQRSSQDDLLRSGARSDQRSFITESVFSHPSKVDPVTRAIETSYRVHRRVLIVPADLSVARVAHRVPEGGHDVPESKIRQRHERLWPHVAAAISHAHEPRVSTPRPERPGGDPLPARNRTRRAALAHVGTIGAGRQASHVAATRRPDTPRCCDSFRPPLAIDMTSRG